MLLRDRADPDFHDAQTALARALCLTADNDNFAEAERLCAAVLEMCRKAHGPRHPKVATAMADLSKVLRASEKLDEAVPLAREA